MARLPENLNRAPEAVVLFALEPQGRKRRVPVRLRGFQRLVNALRFRRRLCEAYPDAFARVYDSLELERRRFPERFR